MRIDGSTARIPTTNTKSSEKTHTLRRSYVLIPTGHAKLPTERERLPRAVMPPTMAGRPNHTCPTQYAGRTNVMSAVGSASPTPRSGIGPKSVGAIGTPVVERTSTISHQMKTVPYSIFREEYLPWRHLWERYQSRLRDNHGERIVETR